MRGVESMTESGLKTGGETGERGAQKRRATLGHRLIANPVSEGAERGSV